MKTAEWLCTSCGTTNRKLVDDSVTAAEDRCIHCGARHSIAQQERPVRWSAAAKS
jgi:DNA-directed RNA polymerase subunit RPC12/RpoP